MRAWMTRLCAGLLIAATAGTAGWYAGAQEKAETVRTLKVNEVARVGERVITAEEFIERVIERERLYADPDLRTAAWALDSLVLDELLLLESDRLEATPKRHELMGEIETLREYHTLMYKQDNADLQRGGGSPYESFEQWLKAKMTLSLAEFDKHLEKLARQRLTLRMVVNFWRMSTKSGEAEGLRCGSLEEATKALARLQKGEKLAVVARDMSNESFTRQNTGIIGTVYPNDGTLRPEVDAAFWKLEKGKFSDVIKADDGFWVVRKTHEQLANEAPFYDLREECIKGADVTNSMLKRWRHAVGSSGRYAFERRMPGWDVKAGAR